jgi:general secretion pathway protein E
VVAVDDAFQALIHDGASEAELERAARRDNPSMLDDGAAKVRAGITTVEEVARVVRDEG